MPLYEVVTTAGTLDDDQRGRIARGITEAHVEVTGAPFEFVHVIFPELPAGHAFTGGTGSAPTFVRGNIRAGRSQEVRHDLMQRIYEIYTAATGVDPTTLLIAVGDFPPSWAMEAGFVLPETTPEAEAAWVAQVRENAASAAAV